MKEFVSLPSGEGFGLNGNILETNIINLSVVIAIVVSFGGDALRSLLENRRRSILTTLEQADRRAREAEEKLIEAKSRLALAQQRGNEIRLQGKETAERERLDAIAQTEKDLFRLEEGREEVLQLRRQRAIGQVCRRVITRALSQVRQKLDQRLDDDFHQSVNYFIIVFFTSDAYWGEENRFYLPSWNLPAK
jgi:F-type H+-transporting ATPase subunit b